MWTLWTKGLSFNVGIVNQRFEFWCGHCEPKVWVLMSVLCCSVNSLAWKTAICSWNQNTDARNNSLVFIFLCSLSTHHTPSLAFQHPSSELCHNWWRRWRGTPNLCISVCGNCSDKTALSVPGVKFVKYLSTKTVQATCGSRHVNRGASAQN